MDTKQLIRFVNTFKNEAREHLAVINRELLTLEQSSDQSESAALLEEIFRRAHSLKGAARTVGFSQIETIAHHLESVFEAARQGQLALSPTICDLLYNGLDMLEIILQEASDTEETPVAIEDLVEQLKQIQVGQVDAVIPAPLPSPKISMPSEAHETIRVNVNKLEALMAQSSELLVFKISSEQRLADLKKIRSDLKRQRKTWRKQDEATDHRSKHDPLPDYWRGLVDSNHVMLNDLNTRLAALEHLFANDMLRLGMVVNNIQEEIRRTRMLPFNTILGGLQRLVRDTSRKLEKDIDFEITGSEIEVDKKILEGLRDPLIHLLSNAMDHGIETASEREAVGKAAHGKITLTVEQRGSQLHLAIADDGRGIDLTAIRAAAEHQHFVESETVSDEEAASFIFISGLSTRQEVTSFSGRGVGLDVVKNNLEALNGEIKVESQPGQGTCFLLTLPISLSTAHGLLVRLGDEFYVLPLETVVKIITIRTSDIRIVGGHEAVTINQFPTALVYLGDILGVPRNTNETPRLIKAVVVRSAEVQIALMVDELIGEQEMVIKSLGKQLRHVPNVAGATLLGNGDVVIILNTTEVIRSSQGIRASNLVTTITQLPVDEPQQTILVVDDSITTRTLEKNILEAAGYLVVTATNGSEALRYLQQNACDLVVSDVQMPILDGIGLARAVRNDSKLSHLPLILVTSLESQPDRERGLEAGADAYIVKSGFDQEDLLTTIRQLV